MRSRGERTERTSPTPDTSGEFENPIEMTDENNTRSDFDESVSATELEELDDVKIFREIVHHNNELLRKIAEHNEKGLIKPREEDVPKPRSSKEYEQVRREIKTRIDSDTKRFHENMRQVTVAKKNIEENNPENPNFIPEIQFALADLENLAIQQIELKSKLDEDRQVYNLVGENFADLVAEQISLPGDDLDDYRAEFSKKRDAIQDEIDEKSRGGALSKLKFRRDIKKLRRERENLYRMSGYFYPERESVFAADIGHDFQRVVAIAEKKLDVVMSKGISRELDEIKLDEVSLPENTPKDITDAVSACESIGRLERARSTLDNLIAVINEDDIGEDRVYNFRLLSGELPRQISSDISDVTRAISGFLTEQNIDRWVEYQQVNLSPDEATRYNGRMVDFLISEVVEGDYYKTTEAVRKIEKFPLSGNIEPLLMKVYRLSNERVFSGYLTKIATEAGSMSSEEAKVVGISEETRGILADINENREDFPNRNIPNPERQRLLSELQNDPEFVSKFAESYLGDRVDTFEVTDFSDLRSEGNILFLDPRSPFGSRIISEFGLSAGEKITKDDPKFQPILVACSKSTLIGIPPENFHFNYEIEDGRDVLHSYDTSINGKVIISPSYTKQLLSRFGMESSATFLHIENPLHTGLDQKICQLAGDLAFDSSYPKLTREAAISYLASSRQAESFILQNSGQITDRIAVVSDQKEQWELVEMLMSKFHLDPDRCAEGILKSYHSIVNKDRVSLNYKRSFLAPEIYQLAGKNPQYMSALLEITEVEDRETLGEIVEFLSDYENVFREYCPDRTTLFECASSSKEGFFDAAKHITSAVSELPDSGRIFLSSYEIARFLAVNPEKVDDIIGLAKLPEAADVGVRQYLIINLEKIASFPPEKQATMARVILRIAKSPSQEMKKIESQLIEQLVDSDDPEVAYDQIEDIYIRNNLPYFVKAYKIFRILHPTIHPHASQVFQRIHKERPSRFTEFASSIIYRDLLKVQVLSGNRNLKEYAQALQKGEEIFDLLESAENMELSENQTRQVDVVLRMLSTIYTETQLGGEVMSDTGGARLPDRDELLERFRDLKKGFGVAEGQKLNDKVSEIFLKPVGLGSLEELITDMDEARGSADLRNRELATEENRIFFEEGDIVKGVDGEFIENILQNGSVAREYLGASADSDATPLDTDVGVIRNVSESFKDTHERCISMGYGNLTLMIKNREDFNLTTTDKFIELEDGSIVANTDAQVDPSQKRKINDQKFELFATGATDAYGVRTGFPSTEISAIIIKKDFEERIGVKKLFSEIAKNGFYIPVVDKDGVVIFSPENYEEERQVFAGLDRFTGPPLLVEGLHGSNRHYEAISQMLSEKKADKENIERVNHSIRSIVAEVFSENDVEVKNPFSRSLVGAEILDIGSTGRDTNLPGNYDFDFTVRLDENDLGKIPQIAQRLMERFAPEQDLSHTEDGGYHQLRAIGAKISEGLVADIDIGFISKSEEVVFGAHDSLREKLNWVGDNLGAEVQEEVMANIVLAKKILKDGHAYKAVDDGGMGGVGVENWILQNGGSIDLAFQSFWEASHYNGKTLSLEEFRNIYNIPDAGINLKFGRRDDYVYKLKPEGYNAMLKVIGEYLGKGEGV